MKSIKNPEFYTKCRACIPTLLEHVISILKSGAEIPGVEVEEVTFTGPSSWSTRTVLKPDYHIFLIKHEAAFQTLPAFKDCIDFMERDPVIGKHFKQLVGTHRGSIRRTPQEFIFALVSELLAKGVDLTNFEDSFSEIYVQHEKFFYDDQVEFRIFAPLRGFDTDVESIELGDSLKIRRISREELARMLGGYKWSFKIPVMEVGRFKYAIEAIYSTEKLFGDLKITDVKFHETEVLHKLLAALNLFKAGRCELNSVEYFPITPSVFLFGFTSGGLYYRPLFGEGYTLVGKEVDNFSNFWNSFKSVDFSNLGSLHIAIRRISDSVMREKQEDKLIDIMIAFESLFLKGDEKGELSYRLALRSAFLLGNAPNEKRQIFREIRDAYDLRSAIVHGRRPPTNVKIGAETISFSELIDRVEELIRRSVKFFLENRKRTVTEVIDSLDDSIFSRVHS